MNGYLTRMANVIGFVFNLLLSMDIVFFVPVTLDVN